MCHIIATDNSTQIVTTGKYYPQRYGIIGAENTTQIATTGTYYPYTGMILSEQITPHILH
jgi:hypothetical protein